MQHITPDDLHTMRQQVAEMYAALIGNKITQDGGMVKRLDVVEDRLDVVEKSGTRIGWQVGMLWLSAGVILTGIMAIIFKK